MPALHSYVVHGLSLVSEESLPIPETAAGHADVTYRRAAGPLPLCPAVPSVVDAPDEPWAVEQWLGAGRVVVDFPGWSSFEISRTEVVLLSDQTGDPGAVSHLLLDHVLPRVVSLRGDLMLHAAGVVGPSAMAHLILGLSGAGKTTLATALVCRGWSLLDDDGIRVIDVDGVLHAVPGYAGLRLMPDAAAALLPGVAHGVPLYEDDSRHRYPLDGDRLRIATEPAPIAAVYVVEEVARRPAGLERLSFAEAMAAVAQRGFFTGERPADVSRQAFVRASALAAAVPIHRLHHRRGLRHLPAMADLVALMEPTAPA